MDIIIRIHEPGYNREVSVNIKIQLVNIPETLKLCVEFDKITNSQTLIHCS